VGSPRAGADGARDGGEDTWLPHSVAVVLPQPSVAVLGVLFADQHRQHRVMPEPVMIVQILVPEAEAEQTLFEQIDHRVLSHSGTRWSVKQAANRSMKPNRSSIWRDRIPPPSDGTRSPIKSRRDVPSVDLLKCGGVLVTLRLYKPSAP
jgi:hypothetical protein